MSNLIIAVLLEHHRDMVPLCNLTSKQLIDTWKIECVVYDQCSSPHIRQDIHIYICVCVCVWSNQIAEKMELLLLLKIPTVKGPVFESVAPNENDNKERIYEINLGFIRRYTLFISNCIFLSYFLFFFWNFFLSFLKKFFVFSEKLIFCFNNRIIN